MLVVTIIVDTHSVDPGEEVTIDAHYKPGHCQELLLHLQEVTVNDLPTEEAIDYTHSVDPEEVTIEDA